ncbi:MULTISPECIES: WYL domain-containing protein [unclassified Paenibacillus]|nr:MULTISPECIES: WYL domain-containing protein [unclassified Paenibacillus]MDF9844350.1 putative DNA-binding transcriptional regulator YafY [Paenibacillus sp. PastF-2]MDF9850954.1 putative DNA-binding transcriptional regulator YafY [Paenibacillus sp. PastM-2]MDF9857525.1 putative DNA-binding transcriptional regulator YafY [Paenibacillus sp. PastF-1]MDH6482834.1 putative DNA-binding transcriptional regulator YafY [Paenibacillus sp. PastH-2]MDH6510259.1 putative DNA-binding transcriptional regul
MARKFVSPITSGLLSWILGWGADVVVTEPESFKNRITEEIKKMNERY